MPRPPRRAAHLALRPEVQAAAQARPVRPTAAPRGRAAWLAAGLLAWMAPGWQAPAQAQPAAPAAARAASAPPAWAPDDHAAWAEMARADPAQGRRLHAELRCAECHARRVGGDGSAIYRPDGRINRPAPLLAMVERCNTELKLQLFPDDVAALAAALNQAHYRLRPPPPAR